MTLDPNSFKQTDQYLIFGKNTDSDLILIHLL